MKTDLHRRFLIGLAIIFMVAFHALAIDVKTATIEQLEKEMYRYYSSNESDSFMLVTDRLIEACREAERYHVGR